MSTRAPTTLSELPFKRTTRNVLSEQPSPYLRQHKNQPVRWQIWDSETLAAARENNLPLLVSVGYSACHWCHVMARESFNDPLVAKPMNEHFINIKIDREERPDLDLIFQFALQSLNQPGGWPLTLFLTPEGQPFWGGTYFPRRSPPPHLSFPELLERIAKLWEQEESALREHAGTLSERVTHWLAPPTSSGQGYQAPFDQAEKALLPYLDRKHGGIGTAPKFPHLKVLEFLYIRSRSNKNPDLATFVGHSIRRICEGGLYDQLGGGVARYAVDQEWTTPHFEKMLYDNALFIESLLLRAFLKDDTRNGGRLSETIDWVLRELRLPGGGFAASIDADSEGEEGLYYLWDSKELENVLGTKAETFLRTYALKPVAGGHSKEGDQQKKILYQENPAPKSVEEREQLNSARRCLRRHRDQRPRPGRDQKLLADWNGLMIASLAASGLAYGTRLWIQEAQSAFRATVKQLGTNDHLAHALGGNDTVHPGLLDDYASMARAALYLHQLDFDTAWIRQAQAWFSVVEREFLDVNCGAYRLTSDKHDLPIAKPVIALDNPVPAGNSIWIEVLTRLYLLTGNEAYRSRRDSIIQCFAGEATRNPASYGTYLCNAVNAQTTPLVTFFGSKDTVKFQRFHRDVFLTVGQNTQLTHTDSKARFDPSDDSGPPEPSNKLGHTKPRGRSSIGPPIVTVYYGNRCSKSFHLPHEIKRWIDEQIPKEMD